MSLLIACDFDGTITQRDTLHVIVERFGVPGVWEALEPRLRSGTLTVEDAMREQFAAVTATRDEVLQAVLECAPLRPGFAEMVEWARADGHDLLVVSAGFRVVIDAVLARAGLHGLEIVSNDALFSRDGCLLVWGEDRGDVCTVCGRRCKRHAIRARDRGRPLVYLGDGVSDVCAAQMADRVFARDGLAAFLQERGLPFTHFDDFRGVPAELARQGARAA